MEKGKIFIVDESEDKLLEMNEEMFAAEIHLQELIAKYPDLLAGDQIDPGRPKKWLLIAREVPIPDEMDGSGRLSLDHLFVDQDSIPTLVECKRSTDTRTRREVVAQMLDYAANATEYLAIEKIRQYAEISANDVGLKLDDALGNVFGFKEDDEIESFWELVEENLRKGKVRLIFAADETPNTLRRTVEFLNDKMVDVEVLIVEIKQFTDKSGLKVLVPRVLGITEAARIGKSTQKGRKRHITEEEFLENCAPATRDFYSKIVNDVKERGHKIYWGEVGFSVRVYHKSADANTSVVYCYPKDTFQVYFAHFKDTNVPNDEVDKMRSKMEQTGIFDKSSEYTLTGYIAQKDLDEVFGIYQNVMDWAEELSNRY